MQLDEEASVQPGLSTARLQLPQVGRAVRYSLDLESLPEFPMFDVLEVVGTEVRVAEIWRPVGEPGFVVDWREVKSWEDAGVALGDDRFHGLPLWKDPRSLSFPRATVLERLFEE